MNRKYTTEEYSKSVDLLKKHIPDVAITTDIMVGFPGETDEDFLNSLNFAEKIGFSKIHVFKYSPRKGTPAAESPDQIAPEIKEARSEKMLALSDRLEEQYLGRFIDREMDVLYEQALTDKKGYIEGLTSNYIRVAAEGTEDMSGKIVRTKLLKINGNMFEGSIMW